MKFVLTGAFAVALVASPAALPAQEEQSEPSEPLETGLEERVEVHLVLIDVVVVDRKGRTIPDLTVEEFELFVGGREVEIASLDVNCPLGAAEDAHAGADAQSSPVSQIPPQTRRIVLVFDYYHMENAALALDAAVDALDRWCVGGEEHMVISLGQALRVESLFTSDMQHVRATLERMRGDRDLYAGNHGTLTNWPFFRRMESLFDLLERFPGRKVVVLFSGPFGSDGFYNDTAYKTLAAMSASSRASVYPVDSGGLRIGTRLGGPGKLRRLANETGGRMTSDTNDIGLAYARAHRDLGCVYTLGFYDRSPRPDRKRRVTVYARRPRRGLRVAHPASYVIRSSEKKRKSLVRSASWAPELFSNAGLKVDLRLLGPHGPQKWDSLIEVQIRSPEEIAIPEIRPPGIPEGPTAVRRATPGRRDGQQAEEQAGQSADAAWELRAYVRNRAGTVLHSFKHRIGESEAGASDEREPAITFSDSLRLRPGHYVVSAVLSKRAWTTPLATRLEVEVPPVPRF